MSITIISKGWSSADKEFSCNNPKVGGKKELSKKKKKKCLNALKKLLKASCTAKCKFGMLIKAYSLIKLILSIILISTFIQVYDSVPNFYHNSGVFKLQFVIVICITKAKVVTADGITEIFDILAGVLQGDTLAPYLFIIVIGYIMTVTIDDDDSDSGFTLRPARSRRIGAEKIADVEFADVVALVTDTIEGEKLLLDRLEKAALSVGLAINDTKTKFITLNMTEEASSLVSCSGNQLEKVTDFVYLGAWIATTEREKPRLGQLATS